MPQGTNLNTSPYYDDFDKTKNYYKVLFKPGFPVQARELTTIQSIFQNQVESVGNYLFKEGSVVIPGGVIYQDYFYAVEIQASFAGLDVSDYLSSLEGIRIRGRSSGIVAKIIKTLPYTESIRNSNTLYLMYESSGSDDSASTSFFDAEELILETSITYNGITINAGESFAITKSTNANSIASSVTVNSGVYYVRGTFVDVDTQTIILDQYSNTPSYRVGFIVNEKIINAEDDNSLYDNSLGSTNFAAPGADRLKITLTLSKKELNDFADENFIEIMRVDSGNVQIFKNDAQLNLIRNELAKRTFDESGDYIVKNFNVLVKNSLNDFVSNNGIYNSNVLLRNGNLASDDVLLYQITPGKAYVKGFDVETITSQFIDIEKPRETKEVTNVSIPFDGGIVANVNRIYGAPTVGMGTTAFVSLRDSRIGSSAHIAAGNEIGVARIYDYSPAQTYVDDTSQSTVRLFDIQTYTTLTLSNSITLSTPAFIIGKNSGAKGYLKNSVSNSTSLTLYQVSGNFVRNEKIIINGNEDGRLITKVTDYNLSDVKSLYSLVGVSTFNADFVLNLNKKIAPDGTIFNITASSGGISTISSPQVNFVGIVTAGNIVAYNNVGVSQTSIIYNKVESVSAGGTSFTVSAITTVSGINIGTLPSSSTTTTNLRIVSPEFVNKNNSGLFTPVGNLNVSEINFSDTEIIIKRQFTNITVTQSSLSVNITDNNLFFQPFTGTNYQIIYTDGTIEKSLRTDEVTVSAGGKTLSINGLSRVSGTCTLICTLKRINSSSKNKFLNRSNSIVISRSSLVTSGIGSTTLNDGLTYSNVYGTRVQDQEISLNIPDAVNILGIFESSGTSDPQVPKLTLNSFTGPTNSTSDFIEGEEIIGQTSNAIAVIVKKSSPTEIEIVYLTSKVFVVGEILTSKDSLVKSSVVSINAGDKNITDNYTFDNGQRETFYDYSRIIRKQNISAPTRKLKIVFQNYNILSSDTGSFVSASSYSPENYSKNIPTYGNYRNTDIIDIRPRVSQYSLSSTVSPFEFSARNFSSSENSSDIVAPNSNLIANYKYYLPRIDKIFLTKDGNFVISKGVANDIPEYPSTISEALEIATISLPAYLYDVKDAKIVLSQSKRYTMKDISNLEDRIERTERLTSLSLLEINAKNFTIKDSFTGLDRFKTGIFVDNFKSHKYHDILDKNFKASIDTTEAVLRPQSYSTLLDLQLGSNAVLGISTNYNPNADLSYVNDLGNSNVKKTGDLLTLNYSVTEYLKQPFATRVENVTPFLVSLWEGVVDTAPSTDNWVNEVSISSNNTIGNYDQLVNQLGVDVKTGLSPIDFVGNFRNNLQGLSDSVVNNFNRETVVSSNLSGGTGTQFVVNETVSTTTNIKEFTEIIKYIRERNVEFTGKNLKPYTRHYPFFDNVDISNFIIPKLLEVTMKSGTFLPGEDVITKSSSKLPGVPYISFRLCTANHKNGPFDAPIETYKLNPYTETALPNAYSSTSTILNVDTKSLQLPANSKYFGWISVGMELVGSRSGAVATVNNIRLYTDNIGQVIGCLYIPDSSVSYLPKYETGTKILRLTSLKENTINVLGSSESAGEGKFVASGLKKTRETITTTIRDAKVTVRTLISPPPPPPPPTPPVVPPPITPPPPTTVVVPPVTTPTPVVRPTPTTTPTPVVRREIIIRNLLRRVDPLAQTFFVDEETGVFLSSVGIFFLSKDEKLPVTLQIRTVELGLPTEEILPFSEVVLDPVNITTSENGLIETRFNFDSPVYLPGGKEYAIVLLSNSNEYRTFIARMGEVDVSTQSLPESQRVIVSKQPTLGSLFKSQNASTWTPSQYEDLKYTLYRCSFTTDIGIAKFFNPKLDFGNNRIFRIGNNSITTISKKTVVGLGSTGYTTDVVPGVTIIQGNSSGKLVSIGGSAREIIISSAGIGYTPSSGSYTYTDVNLQTETGYGFGAVGVVTVTDGSISAISLSNGGNNYVVGDVLNIGNLGVGIGTGSKFTITSIGSSNTFNLDNIQGNFSLSSSELQYINSSGIVTTVGLGVSVISVLNDNYYDGLHIKIKHSNHGMHSKSNYIKLFDLQSNITPITLNTNLTSSTIGNISVSSSSGFETFEGVGVGTTNPGYLLIGNEIISYTSVSTGVIGIQSRGIDGTIASIHDSGQQITKYELNGVSLRRINTTHNFAEVDSPNLHFVDLDNYHIKIDMSKNGIDRTGNSPFPKLHFERTSVENSGSARATENIQYESIIPSFNTLILGGTNISGKVRTVSGTSISGNEESFLDQGFENISLNGINYFKNPRLICSQINEEQFLSNIPGNKSLTMELTLSTNNNFVSPVIDLETSSLILTTNRINSPIDNYAKDGRVNSLNDDPHSAIYVSNKIIMKNSADSIKVILSAKLSASNGIRVLYKLFRTDVPDEDQVWELFPGYSNIDSLGNTINPEFSDGTSDKPATPEYYGNFTEYEYTANNLPQFQGYQIKIVMYGTNQADIPQISELRAIATA